VAVDEPLSGENARIDIKNWQLVITDQKQFTVNIFTINNGKDTALSLRHAGFAFLHPQQAPDSAIAPLFAMLRATIKLSPPAPRTEMHVTQADTWFSVFGQVMDDKQLADLKAGTLWGYAVTIAHTFQTERLQIF
jgi:hypothetical protein